MDLGELPARWQTLEALYRLARDELQARDPDILHARMIDEGQTAGRRAYMGAQRCLSVAWDNHDALISLLRHHGATQFAPWNLLRPTFEASFYALWLLDPEDSIERRRRGLMFEWLDELEHRTYYADLAAVERFVGLMTLRSWQPLACVRTTCAGTTTASTEARLRTLVSRGRCPDASTFSASSES